jgi:hypothetical protein
MKKNFVLLVFAGLLSIFNQSLTAQEENAVPGKLFYAELGGPGVIMSANWDGRFKSNTQLGFGYRIGVGFGVGEFQDKLIESPYGDYAYYEHITKTYYSIPVGLNYVFGKPDMAPSFEVGAGATFLTREVSIYNYDVEKPGYVIGHVAFMFRVTPVNGGMSFRIGFTPIIGTAGDLFPMGAVSLGYAF